MYYKQSQDAFAEITGEEIMLLEVNTNAMYRSNAIGAFIWEHLDGCHTVEEIVGEIMKVCRDVREELVWVDVLDFIEDLQDKGLIKKIHLEE